MKNLLSLAAAFALLSTTATAHNHAGDTADHDHSVYGLWLVEAGNSRVRIADCGPGDMADTPCGTVETASIPQGEPTTDVNNEDPALRDLPIIGLTMLDGFERDGSKWKKGRIYNPEDGNSYKSSIRLDKDNPDVLRVKGCIAFLCQTQEWTRVSEVAE